MRDKVNHLNYKKLTAFIIIVAAFLFCLLALIQNYFSEWAEWAGIGEDRILATSTERTAAGEVTKVVTTETTQSAKTLWDWLNTLIIPVSLAILGLWFQHLQYKQSKRQQAFEREIADSNLNEDVLQTYLDRLSELLLGKALNQLKLEDPQRAAAMDIVRARTLSVLRRLDEERKGSVIRFLFDAEFITKLKLDLEGADLYSASLRGVDLRGAKLTSVNLTAADLRGANLEGADLSESILVAADLGTEPQFDRYGTDLYIRPHTNLRAANLIFANLQNANLSDADLTGADLTGSDLTGANLYNANLTGAKAIVVEQIQVARNWQTAIYDSAFNAQLGLSAQRNRPKTFTDFVKVGLQAESFSTRGK